jgi:hypothetical protein
LLHALLDALSVNFAEVELVRLERSVPHLREDLRFRVGTQPFERHLCSLKVRILHG